MNKKLWFIVISAVLLLIAGRIVLDVFFSPKPSDEQMILLVIEGTKAAAEKRDSNAILQLISSSFKSEDFTYKQLELMLKQTLKDIINVQVQYNKPSVEVMNDKAKVVIPQLSIQYDYQNGGADGMTLTNVELEFVKETTKKYLLFDDYVWRYAYANKIPGASQ